jgi:hypothetical protein
MDGVGIAEDLERQIEEIMTDLGLTREEALIVLGRSPGYALGDSDIVCIHPLTDEEWRRLGLGRNFREVLAEQEARQARERAVPDGRGRRESPAPDPGGDAGIVGSRQVTRRRGDRSG